MKIDLTNVLINVIDAMPLNKGTLKISTKITDSKYTIGNDDNGCSINKERLKHISLPSYCNKPKGKGMGLVLTYNIFTVNDVE